MPTCWGYARRSTDYEDQAESLTRQCSKIPLKFAQIKLSYPNLQFDPEKNIFSETISATTVRYDERPECVKLFSLLRKGDHLIVENLQRLDRGALRQVACLSRLKDMGIFLWDIDSPLFPNGVQLDSYMGAILITACHMQTIMWGMASSEGRKRSAAAKKAKNEPYTTWPPIGFMWGEDENRRSIWVEDIPAQDLIREIVFRRHGCWHLTPNVCESWADIGYDMLARKASFAGTRGKSNLDVSKIATPRRRRLAYIRPRMDGTPLLECKHMKFVYRQYRDQLLSGFEFKIPIEEAKLLRPGRKEELEWLLKVFKLEEPHNYAGHKQRHLAKLWKK